MNTVSAGVHERRAEKIAAVSTGQIIFAFDKGTTPKPNEVQAAWAQHAARNFQRVQLGACVTRYSIGSLDYMIFNASYGPVVGNWQPDYYRKANAVAKLLGACYGDLIRPTFVREEVKRQ